MPPSPAAMIAALDAAQDTTSLQMEIVDAVALLMASDRERMKKTMTQVSDYVSMLSSVPDAITHLRHFGRQLIATIVRAQREGRMGPKAKVIYDGNGEPAKPTKESPLLHRQATSHLHGAAKAPAPAAAPVRVPPPPGLAEHVTASLAAARKAEARGETPSIHRAGFVDDGVRAAPLAQASRPRPEVKMQALPGKVMIEPPPSNVQMARIDDANQMATPPAPARERPPMIVLDGKAKDLVRVQLDPTNVCIVPPPPSEVHPEFASAFAAALRWRIGLTLTFFHRRNPDVVRQMPEPFLISENFAAKFDRVVQTMIIPRMMAIRSAKVIENRYPWGQIGSEEFWIEARRDRHEEPILAAWRAAWDSFRQTVVVKDMGHGQPPKKILKASPDLLLLRDALGGPDGNQPYLIPKIGNRELDLFVSLLIDDFDRDHLENTWTKLRQLYEQELERRDYQAAGREGALRDAILDCMDRLPDSTGEFIALMAHYCFGNVGIKFLDDFVKSKGINRDERLNRVPYIMAFIEDDRIEPFRRAEAKRRAIDEEAARERKRREIEERKMT